MQANSPDYLSYRNVEDSHPETVDTLHLFQYDIIFTVADQTKPLGKCPNGELIWRSAN